MRLPYRTLIRWAVRRAVVGRSRNRSQPERGRFTGAEVDRFVSVAWQKYEARASTLPSQPTRGSRINVRFAALTIALFQVLIEAGVERADAIMLISDTTWQIYEQWGRIGRSVLRILPESLTKPLLNDANVAKRVRKDGTFMLGFPFEAPGYIAQHVPMKGTAAFDMIRCPVAAMFQAYGAADLCRSAWCDLITRLVR